MDKSGRDVWEHWESNKGCRRLAACRRHLAARPAGWPAQRGRHWHRAPLTLAAHCAQLCPTATPLLQTWDDASRSAWESWMSARAYAGGTWKDAQRAAESYWRDTKGRGPGGGGGIGLGGSCWVLGLVFNPPCTLQHCWWQVARLWGGGLGMPAVEPSLASPRWLLSSAGAAMPRQRGATCCKAALFEGPACCSVGH